MVRKAGPVLKGSTHPAYEYTVKVFDGSSSTARMFRTKVEAQRFKKLFNQGKIR